MTWLGHLDRGVLQLTQPRAQVEPRTPHLTGSTRAMDAAPNMKLALAILVAASLAACTLVLQEDTVPDPLVLAEHAWLQQYVGEGSAESDGVAFSSVLTLGYDPDKKSFVGTSVDSVTPYLWTITGQLDDAKNVLTLETEGPR